MEAENSGMKEKNDTVKFSFWITTVIILAGAIVTFTMYTLI